MGSALKCNCNASLEQNQYSCWKSTERTVSYLQLWPLSSPENQCGLSRAMWTSWLPQNFALKFLKNWIVLFCDHHKQNCTHLCFSDRNLKKHKYQNLDAATLKCSALLKKKMLSCILWTDSYSGSHPTTDNTPQELQHDGDWLLYCFLQQFLGMVEQGNMTNWGRWEDSF